MVNQQMTEAQKRDWARMLQQSWNPRQWFTTHDKYKTEVEEEFGMWIFIKGDDKYTVGFYDKEGVFHEDTQYDYREQAAKRVNYLNGGKND